MLACESAILSNEVRVDIIKSFEPVVKRNRAMVGQQTVIAKNASLKFFYD